MLCGACADDEQHCSRHGTGNCCPQHPRSGTLFDEQGRRYERQDDGGRAKEHSQNVERATVQLLGEVFGDADADFDEGEDRDGYVDSRAGHSTCFMGSAGLPKFSVMN